MKWLKKIQEKPHKKKMQIFWFIIGLCFAALILLWGFTSQIGKKKSGDLGLFSAFSQGVDNFQKAWRERSNHK